MAETEDLHLTCYTHEIQDGLNASPKLNAGTGQGGDLTAAGWGSFVVFDNIVKEGLNEDSKTLGKFSGWGVVTSIGGIPAGGAQMSGQFDFGEGSEYNGSSIAVTGTVSVPGVGPPPPWERIIVGGTGKFRGCKGYAIAQPAAQARPLSWHFQEATLSIYCMVFTVDKRIFQSVRHLVESKHYNSDTTGIVGSLTK
uniref:Dirigent protein n=1 Tax=Physcomitrium patens TaxID=3218 RepID=A0A7I4B3A3_PHYPA